MAEELTPVQRTYKLLNDKYTVEASEEEFAGQMATKGRREKAYGLLSEHYTMPSFEEYNDKMVADLGGTPAQRAQMQLEQDTEDNISNFDNFWHSAVKSLYYSPQISYNQLFGDFKRADEIVEIAQRELPTEAGAADFLGSVIGGTLPFMAAMAPMFVPGGQGASAILMPALFANYGLQAAGQGRGAVRAFEQESGTDVSGASEAIAATGYGIAVFAAERAGLGALSKTFFNKMSKNALIEIAEAYATKKSGAAAAAIAKHVARITPITAGIEGLEEGAEQLMTNAIDMTYNPDARTAQALLSGVGEATLGGALGGALLGGFGGTLQGLTGRGFQVFDPEMVGDQTDAEVMATKEYLEEQDAFFKAKGGNIFELYTSLKEDINAPNVSAEVLFQTLADGQRGAPERAMVSAQRTLGTGVVSFVLEHAGDLTHRMSQKISQLAGDFESVKSKVDRVYKVLHDGYGFEKEAQENLVSNGVTREDRDAALLTYAEAHKKLKTHNNIQTIANELAVAIGEQRWDAARAAATKLKRITDQGQAAYETAAKENSDKQAVSLAEKQVAEEQLKILEDEAFKQIGDDVRTTLIQKHMVQGVFDNMDQTDIDNNNAAKVMGVMNDTKDAFDVESPYKRILAPVSGLTAKLFYPRIANASNMGNSLANTIFNFYKKDQKMSQTKSREMMNEAVFLYEDKAKFEALPADQKAIHQPTMDALDEFFDFWLQQYKQFDVLDDDFIGGRVKKLEVDITKQEQLIDVIEKEGGIATIERTELRALQQELKRTNDTKFIHIPTEILFDYIKKRNPKKFEKIKKSFFSSTTKERKNLRLADIINNKDIPITAEDVNMWEIIASYSRKAGKDIALAHYVRALEQEGLAIRLKNLGPDLEPKLPFKLPRARSKRNNYVDHAVGNEKYRMHPLAAQMLKDMEHRSERKAVLAGQVTKMLSITKMAQFFNPFFLPMYDVVQAMIVGSINPLRPIRTGKYVYQAIMDYKNQSQEWYDSGWNGSRSTPIPNPLSTELETADAMATAGGETGKLLRDMVDIRKGHKYPQTVLKAAYNLSWKTAWLLDGIIRQVTYRYGLDKGMTSVEAAQQAALYHGDYAGVPAEMRKKLNLVFFTPTFKIAMAKMYSRMLQSVGETMLPQVKTGEDLAQHRMSFIRLTAIVFAIDIIMTSIGFERDQWGRRYVRHNEFAEDEKSDTVMTFSNPANLFLKYLYRWFEAFGPEVDNSMQRFLQSNVWELHPFYRVASDLANNRTPSGDKIVLTGDRSILRGGAPDKEVKTIKYLIDNLIPLIREVRGKAGAAGVEGIEDPRVREQLAKDVGEMFTAVTAPFTFAYARAPKEIQLRNDVSAIKRFIAEDKNKIIDTYIKTGDLQGLEEIMPVYQRRFEEIVAAADIENSDDTKITTANIGEEDPE